MCKLQKSLYELKQAPKQWYKKFDKFIQEIEFSRCHVDHYCYIKRYDNSFIFLLFYDGDILIEGSCVQEVKKLKTQLSCKFVMKDMGAAN